MTQNLPKTSTLRPFDDTDWMAFAGCENENPWIAYKDEAICDGFACTAVVVVDGPVVQVYFEDPDQGTQFFGVVNRAKWTNERAMYVGSVIAGAAVVASHELSFLGLERIG